jgi:hypothetical protein
MRRHPPDPASPGIRAPAPLRRRQELRCFGAGGEHPGTARRNRRPRPTNASRMAGSTCRRRRRTMPNHGLYPHRVPDAQALPGVPQPTAPGNGHRSPPLGESSNGLSPQKRSFKGRGRRYAEAPTLPPGRSGMPPRPGNPRPPGHGNPSLAEGQGFYGTPSHGDGPTGPRPRGRTPSGAPNRATDPPGPRPAARGSTGPKRQRKAPPGART